MTSYGPRQKRARKAARRYMVFAIWQAGGRIPWYLRGLEGARRIPATLVTPWAFR